MTTTAGQFHVLASQEIHKIMNSTPTSPQVDLLCSKSVQTPCDQAEMFGDHFHACREELQDLGAWEEKDPDEGVQLDLNKVPVDMLLAALRHHRTPSASKAPSQPFLLPG